MTVLCAPYIVAWSAVIRIHIQKFPLVWYPYWHFLQEIKESTQTKLALCNQIWSLQFYTSNACTVYIIYTHSVVGYPKCQPHIFHHYKTGYGSSPKNNPTTKYHWPGGLYSPTDSQLLIPSLFLHS